MERFFITTLVVAIFVAVCFAPFWLSWFFDKLRQVKNQGRARNLIHSWGISKYSYNPSWQPMVYFLNSGGKIIQLPLLEFHQLRMPKSEMPKWWILRLGTNPEKYEDKDKIHLIHEGQIDNNHWHFSSWWGSITAEKSHLKLFLQDRDGKSALIKIEADEGCDGLMTKTLETVSIYRDVNDAWIKTIQKEGVPILLETKDSMGKSPKIGALRYILEHGPSPIFEFGESILPKALLA